MNFLGKLADQISSQLSIGENDIHSLDAVIDGQNQKYGSLGDFARKFDQSAERRYVEEGYLRKDSFNTDPKQFEVLMQEPSATVLVKKRAFSSISENYRPDFMDSEEKLYYKAMKILFQNKCRQIAALEKLSKIQKITSAVGNISDQLMPIIISLTDDAGSGFSSGGFSLFGGFNSDGEVSNFTKVIDRIRRIYAFNNTNSLTTWVTDSTNLFQSQFGQGTGVIEITNFTNLSTTVGLDIKNPGRFQLSISDPYEAMTITEYDIERALGDATNANYNHKIFQFGQQGAEQVIADAKERLNQLRSLRKVSPITFKINPDTLLGRRVIAILDRIGTEIPFTYSAGGQVKVADEYLFNSGEFSDNLILGVDGLATTFEGQTDPDTGKKPRFPESELSAFKRLVAAIYSKLDLEANTRSIFVQNNKNTNYARRKLRFNFSGKLIIQPMDLVHIYVNSKSRYDNKLLSGLQNMFTGSGILQNINKTVVDLKNSIDTVFNPGGSVNFQVEKNSYVGKDFPNYLWSLIRNQFVLEKEGTHVFAGIVQSATDDWSDGKYTVSVSGTDNSAYFEMGKINFQPGVDNFNGSFFDPLTPFKTKFDTISSEGKGDSPELLEENKILLGTSSDGSSPLAKYKLGPNMGKPAYEDNVAHDVSIEKATRFLSKIYYAPDGLVYKWKEGIGTLIQFGSTQDINDPFKVGSPNLAKEPFAGQDIMNVISLLVTGKPYNFANYWKAVVNYDSSGADPFSNQNGAKSYFDSLKSDLEKNNAMWGNFIPFKTLTMDEQSFANLMTSQRTSLQENRDIENKLRELSELKTRLNIFQSPAAIALTNKFDADVKANFEKARIKTNEMEEEVSTWLKNKKTEVKTTFTHNFGSDNSFDFDEFLDLGDPNKKMSDSAQRRLIRRQVNYLTRRMSYNVRANDDKNLFIIDDYYDKDFDLAAYEKSLADGIKLFNNEFTSVKEKIVVAADLLNLEVFADTQGHIRVRPPQYNRMPSSIFYRMMFLKKSTGIQIYPQFLEDLFGDQIKTLKERVEIIEDQIRLDCAVLGIGESITDKLSELSDSEVDLKFQKFINSQGISTGSEDTFNFISGSNGLITDLDQVTNAAHPEEKLKINESSLTFTKLENQALIKRDIFNNEQRFKIVLDALSTKKLESAGYGIMDTDSFNENDRIDKLIKRIEEKSGQKIARTSYLLDAGISGNGANVSVGQAIDIFKVTQEIADKIGERQKAIKLLHSSIKNLNEARTLDDDPSTANRLITPGVYGNSHTPEIFEHMIEDESYDDYGPGSGSRYIIKRAQIRNISISENPPDYTMVEVRGVLNEFAPTSLPSDLNSFAKGGNGIVTAAAIDYDTWRNYGYRDQNPINVPFLSDPATQCAPYATMLLSRARRNILRGSVTISGNEYMQPGEVVFLQDRGMLFYVSSVKHNFTIGSGFTTTLDLTYGHSPGEYIPTTLDVIGKLLYKNRDVSQMIVQRQSNSLNQNSVGILIKDPKNSTVINKGEKNDPVNHYSAPNTQTINNILYSTSYIMNANNTKGNNIKAKLELRVYIDKNNSVPDELNNFAEEIKRMLTTSGEGPKQPSNKVTGTIGNSFVFNKNDVEIVPINMDDKNEKRSPSQKAINSARDMVTINSSGSGSFLGNVANAALGVGKAIVDTFKKSDKEKKSSNDNNKQKELIRKMLFNYIVDCWVVITEVPASEAKANGS